ncbi:formimidoylglutamase [Pedobacter sp. L105]|uniref:formimidoylglutamase n=1 Tax=Pedobacter sp. L105 TaxID=1641871 RepID=UPI00131B8F0E|nr:formimidoylglutamase [Pedobacter sp. L105]
MAVINPEFYNKTPEATWKGRNDGTDPASQRWHQRIVTVDLLEETIPILQTGQKGIALIGFACDEGVKRNGGRTGAKDAPLHFRMASGSLPVHFNEETLFVDLGDITCDTEAMEEAQQALADLVTAALGKGYLPLVIGGGHEVAYGHFSGINNHINSSATIGIINFDAHFDLREPAEKGTNSGTGFLQIAHDCKDLGIEFRYLPIGIQRNSNTKLLFNRALSLNVNHISAELFSPSREKEIFSRIKEFIEGSTHVYLTICMDVFSSAAAPGVSAPAYSGIFPDPFFFSCLTAIISSGKVISMDIAEYNPAYDTDQRTAKLAAALAFSMISN